MITLTDKLLIPIQNPIFPNPKTIPNHNSNLYTKSLTVILTVILTLTPKPKISFFLVGSGEMSLFYYPCEDLWSHQG